MSKKIYIEFEGETYTLFFTKRVCKNMEQAGFVADEVPNKPHTMIPMLVRGAFQANHPLVNDKLRDLIYDSLFDKPGFIEVLGELYNEPMLELIADPDGDEKNAPKWRKSWADPTDEKD